MTDHDEATVRDGITAPPSHLASGFIIDRHDEAHAALSRILAERATLQAEVEKLREALREVRRIVDKYGLDYERLLDDVDEFNADIEKLHAALAQPTEGQEPPVPVLVGDAEVTRYARRLEAEVERLREALQLIADDPLRPYLAVQRAERALAQPTEGPGVWTREMLDRAEKSAAYLKARFSAQPTEGQERCPTCGRAGRHWRGTSVPPPDCPDPWHTEGQEWFPNG